MHIQLFGNLAISHRGKAVQFQTRKVGALFAYLAAHTSVPFTRSQLATLLWGEYPDKPAKRNLSMSLTRLKRAMQQADTPNPVRVMRKNICFQQNSMLTFDLHQFNALWDRCEEIDRAMWAGRGQIVQLLTEAVDLYRGGFLDGVSLPDSPEFNEWVRLQRQAYHDRALLALETVADYHLQQGDWAEVEQFANRQLALELWHEKAHQQLIQLYVQTNRPDAAFAQYGRCKQILWDEFGVAPALATDAAIASADTPPTIKPIRTIAPFTSGSLLESSRPAELPIDETPFLGRTHELAQLQALIRERTYRLITLVGQGGVGKTRLGLTLARSQLSYFAHGVFFVSLVGVNSAENIPHTIANALNLTLAGQQPPLQQLSRYLQKRELLLVLDNIEHLLAQDSTIDTVLELYRTAPNVLFVVTSRSQLWVRAETVFPVGGLSYPVHQQAESLATQDLADSYDAIHLFVERSRRLCLGFTPQKERLAIIRICQLVDGLPLGIELAAAQSAITNCTDVANQLEKSIRVLETRMRDMPARQRSLQATFDYSWQLLSPCSQKILAQLSIFRDKFTLARVATIVPAATEAQLRGLERHSLLSQREAGWYQVNEIVRQLAFGRLDEAQS